MRGGRRQTACKPGSVRALRRGTAIPLGRALLRASRDQPGRRGGNASASAEFFRSPAAPIRSCSRWGLPCRPRCRGRGALLPHRFTLAGGELPPCAGGLFSVALSLGSPPPAVSRHRIPVEPGLSSTAFACGSGRPAVWHRAGAADCAPCQSGWPARCSSCHGCFETKKPPDSSAGTCFN